MEYVTLGDTGLKVSRIWLGMMSYGDPGWRSWVLDESSAESFVTRALELGINTFDTADMYSRGVSEEVTGRLLRAHADREDVVIATKVFFPTTDGVNRSGLSRKHVMEAIDASLTRLGVDHVDLYQIHRWDPVTPIEETMEALHDVVRAGKARYIGASSMYAWQFAKAQHVADTHGWTRFVSMQPHYNLLYREEEREMLPQCRDMGVGVVPWSPLARGRLARPSRTPATRRPRGRRRTTSATTCTATSPSRTGRSRSGSTRSRHGWGSRQRRSHSRGCSGSRASPHRSWGRRNSPTSRTPSPRST